MPSRPSLPRDRQHGSQKTAGRARRESPPIRARDRWRPPVLVCAGRRRRFEDAPSKRNSAECGRDADRHRAPNGSACNPKTCTSVLWDGARERRRSSLAREGADTLRGSWAATGRCDPRTSSDRCRGLWARRCNLPPARRALRSRRVQPRGRSSVQPSELVIKFGTGLGVSIGSVDRGDEHAVNGRLEISALSVGCIAGQVHASHNWRPSRRIATPFQRFSPRQTA